MDRHITGVCRGKSATVSKLLLLLPPLLLLLLLLLRLQGVAAAVAVAAVAITTDQWEKTRRIASTASFSRGCKSAYAAIWVALELCYRRRAVTW
jgi:hypothetical protein